MSTTNNEPDWAELLEGEDDPPKQRRTKKSLYDDRILANWIKLPHDIHRSCEVPLHEAVTDRPRTKGTTVIIDDIAVCRICFLNNADKENG